MSEWLWAHQIVVQHPQEHLAHAACTVYVPVRLALGAPAYTADTSLLEGPNLSSRYILSSSREQPKRMGYVRFCCLEGALAAHWYSKDNSILAHEYKQEKTRDWPWGTASFRPLAVRVRPASRLASHSGCGRNGYIFKIKL
jgi:hypothetical protein